MTGTRDGLPEGRYGRTTAAGSARRLRLVGAVLAVLFAAMIGWFGWSYIAGQDVTGEVIRYKVVSDEAVEVHLEVHKPAGTVGVRTLRSRDVGGKEVARKDVRIKERAERVDT